MCEYRAVTQSCYYSHIHKSRVESGNWRLQFDKNIISCLRNVNKQCLITDNNIKMYRKLMRCYVLVLTLLDISLNSKLTAQGKSHGKIDFIILIRCNSSGCPKARCVISSRNASYQRSARRRLDAARHVGGRT